MGRGVVRCGVVPCSVPYVCAATKGNATHQVAYKLDNNSMLQVDAVEEGSADRSS